jgi:hypothetical protein
MKSDLPKKEWTKDCLWKNVLEYNYPSKVLFVCPDSSGLMDLPKRRGAEWNRRKWALCSRGHFSGIWNRTKNLLSYYNHNQHTIGIVLENICFMNSFGEFRRRTGAIWYLVNVSRKRSLTCAHSITTVVISYLEINRDMKIRHWM